MHIIGSFSGSVGRRGSGSGNSSDSRIGSSIDNSSRHQKRDFGRNYCLGVRCSRLRESTERGATVMFFFNVPAVTAEVLTLGFRLVVQDDYFNLFILFIYLLILQLIVIEKTMFTITYSQWVYKAEPGYIDIIRLPVKACPQFFQLLPVEIVPHVQFYL